MQRPAPKPDHHIHHCHDDDDDDDYHDDYRGVPGDDYQIMTTGKQPPDRQMGG